MFFFHRCLQLHGLCQAVASDPLRILVLPVFLQLVVPQEEKIKACDISPHTI